MKTMTFAVLAAVSIPRIFAITVEVTPGESEAVCLAAENLRRDIERACPDHAKDARKIVVRTTGKGAWESSVRTYANGTWTVTGADRRGTVYGIYAISDELGVSPFHWMDDIPVAPRAKFDLSEKTKKIDSPAVKYRGIFINDEGWCLRAWAVHNYEADGTKSLGAKTYEKIFEMMLRCRLNVIWPAMHPGGYEFVTRPENMELADKMGIVVGTSHCEPMLRNNVYWDKKTQGPWNYATNRAEIDKYWQWSVDRYLNQEILWTIGIRGTHDEPMAGNSIADKIAVMDEVFKTQLGMLGVRSQGLGVRGQRAVAMNFIPYKEVLPLYEAGLKVPKDASIMWVDDNFGYIRRLGGPGAADHTGGMYWHVSYFGGPHSFTHVCTTAPGFMWYELGAKCSANNAKETWILNVGDVKPADILIDAFGKIAWDPKAYGANAQTKILVEWVEKFIAAKDAKSTELRKRIVRHMDNYYRLGTIRKPELMAKQWVEKLTDEERKSLMSQYVALEQEDKAIEAELKKLTTHNSQLTTLPNSWFDAFGFQVRFLSAAGRYFMSDDWLEESGKARVQAEINALCKRYDEIFGGKWKGFWFDTFPVRGWDNTENGWASQMQWPWKEPKKGRYYDATAGGNGIAEEDWVDAARFVRSSKAKDGAWAKVRGLGISNKAMALLPVKEGCGKGAWLEYEIGGQGSVVRGQGAEVCGYYDLVLQFLPDYRLYPGMKLRVEVNVNGGAPQIVEVPYSDGSKDENSQGRNMAVQDNFVRAILPCAGLKDGKNTIRVTALDAGVVLDRLAIRAAPEKMTHPFEKAWLRGTTEKREYKIGEKIDFVLRLDDAYSCSEGEYFIRWRMFDDDGKMQEGKEPLPLAKPIVISNSLSKPGFMRVSAVVVDKNGKEIRSTWKKSGERIFFEGGIGVEVDKIRQVAPEPNDFDAYWAKQVARLKTTPMKVLSCKELESKNPKVKLYAIVVSAPARAVKPASAETEDVARVTGYLSVPADGRKVPARVEFRGYGVHREAAPSWWLNENQIWFLVNAHGSDLDREQEFYRQLHDALLTTDSKGRRHEYGLNPDENASPDTAYFNGMVMRVLRALEYVKSRSEWDGKTLVTAGGSQGGLQSVWGAALDKDVTRVECEIPWNCDFVVDGSLRIQPTWKTEWAPGLAYYSCCNMARRIRSPKTALVSRAALGDELCPPAGVAAFYNNLPCEKSIKWVQGSTHGYVPQFQREEWIINSKGE